MAASDYYIPGRRRGTMGPHVPYRLMKMCNKATKIDACLIPQPDQAVSDYRQNGGSITDPEHNIDDPLSMKKDIRFRSFTERFPSFEAIFYDVVNENASVFVDALIFYIDLTFRLSF